MKRISLFFLTFMLCHSCFSQLPVRSIGTITSLEPEWLHFKLAVVRKNAVLRDSAFSFGASENNQDSALIMIQYFDSLGNLSEMDEYSIKNKGEIVRITRMTYVDEELYQKEITAKTIDLFSKISNYQKELRLYEYDSAGNNITEKLYEYYGESLDKHRLTVYDYLYDSASHIIESYRKTENSNRFLQRQYTYNNGILDEVNYYDSNREVTYTKMYRMDTKKNVERIYDGNVSPDYLQQEFFYDDKKRLKQEKFYFKGAIYLTHSYWYSSNGLIDMQIVKSENDGTKYYYKHHYAKQ